MVMNLPDVSVSVMTEGDSRFVTLRQGGEILLKEPVPADAPEGANAGDLVIRRIKGIRFGDQMIQDDAQGAFITKVLQSIPGISPERPNRKVGMLLVHLLIM